MNVLVIGSGGREHTLAWKIAQSEKVKNVYVAPGNGGTATENKCTNIDIDVNDFAELIRFVKGHNVHLTVVGPEDPLAGGIVDIFEAEGLRIFGPNKDAAQLEASKAFAKEIMIAANIPTAFYKKFDSFEDAKIFVEEKGAPIVVKADGLAAGKGVTVAFSVDEAISALEEIFHDNAFGDAGKWVIVEEFLKGEEASYLAFSDGETILPLASSQDHKAAYDGDKGPNTGGMGAYSPAPVVTDEIFNYATEKVAYPLIKEMKKRGIIFKGIIYAGLMISDTGINVLEFNARMGDPETQPVLMKLKSDIVPVIEAAIDGKLNTIKLEWHDEATVCVVMASGGYPKQYKKGYSICCIDEAETIEGVKVFHAGTKLVKGEIVNTGGRVLGVTARHANLATAIENAYKAVDKIHWEAAFFRKDIGQKALNRK